MIREAFKQEKQVSTKSSLADLVTESDKKVEQLIISTVKDKFPTHRLVAVVSCLLLYLFAALTSTSHPV